MKKLYLLDRLIPKHIEVSGVPDDMEFGVGEKVVYKLPDDDTLYVGQNVGYPLEADRKGAYIEKLTDRKLEKFEEYQKKSQTYYAKFKDLFPKACVGAIPVTARSNLAGSQIYFYFYAEERYNFSDFVRSFRAIVPVQFFIYQLGARDMIRYSPAAKDYLIGCDCRPIGCGSLGKLPSVEMDNIALQSLEGRDIEKLKGRCGKLKCSLVYERELYLAEIAGFPKKGDMGKMYNQDCVCIGHNIMTGDIVAKTQGGELLRGPKKEFHLSSTK